MNSEKSIKGMEYYSAYGIKDNLNNIPHTSIVILTYNNLEYNKLCIDSIRKYTRKGTYEIVIVDNNSTDGTKEWLKTQNNLKIIFNDENDGFPKGCNQGINASEKNNDILLLNNDTIVTPNWLDNLKICLYSSKNIGSVGSVTNSCSNHQTVQAEYNNINEMIDFAEKYNKSNPSLWEERVRLVGFCMLIKREVVNKIGLLDEIFTPGNFEDDDYSFRMRSAGYKLILCKDSYIHHFGSTSFNKDNQKYAELLNTNREKFKTKWGVDPHSIIDEQITNLSDSNTKIDDRNLKFLLRRIENNIEYDESLSEVLDNIYEDDFDYDSIVMSIDKHIIKKEMLLNAIALGCYKEGMVDFSLRLLMKSYEINLADKDTIYNIAYIAGKIGEKELAISFLNSARDKDDEMLDLLHDIMEEANE